MAQNRFALAVLSILLLAQLAYPLWSQGLNITVVDKAGVPVKAAVVEITYQKADAASSNDGRIRGQTGNDGSFHAVLSNSVDAVAENRTCTINVSTYFWKGSSATFEADNSGQKKIRFPIPFDLESVQIRAIPPDGLSPGAQATIYGSVITETLGANGTTSVFVPKGMQFSGYIVSDGKSKIFYSDNATVDTGGRRTIDVWLPDSWRAGGSLPSAKRIAVRLTFITPHSGPYADLPISYVYRGNLQTAITDSTGTAAFDAFSGIPLNMTLAVDEYARNILYTANETKTDTVQLPQLLSIAILPPSQEGENCYRVMANVSDPRKQLPLEVMFIGSAGGISSNITPSSDELGRLFVRTCITSDTNLTVRASNKYDSTSESVMLPFAVSRPGQQQGTQPGKQQELPSKLQAENYFLWALLAVLVAVVAGVVFFAKKSLGASFSFILNYLRLIYGSVQQTRRPVPASAKKLYEDMENAQEQGANNAAGQAAQGTASSQTTQPQAQFPAQAAPSQGQPQSQASSAQPPAQNPVQPPAKKQGLFSGLFGRKKKDAPSTTLQEPPAQPPQE